MEPNQGQVKDQVGLFYENPATSNTQHPVNYLRFLGRRLQSYRLSLPFHERGRDAFGRRLAKYIGKPVPRNRLSRCEKGDAAVGLEVYAAYAFEAGMIPKLMKAFSTTDPELLKDTYYLMLLNNKAQEKIADMIKRGEQKLAQRAIEEKQVNDHVEG